MPDAIFLSGGASGTWKVLRQAAVKGAPLPPAARIEKGARAVAGAAWTLSGVTSNLRYTNAIEKRVLDATPSVLGRPAATRAALIPITKSAAWWALAQDERRSVLEEQSRPIAIGSDPAHADEGAAAPWNGVRTTASSGFWDWPDGRIPFVGALRALLDGQNRMRGDP